MTQNISIQRDRRKISQRNAVGIVGVTLVTLIIISSLLAPIIAPEGYDQQDLTRILQAPGVDWAAPLGTDELGRSMLTRLLYGGRTGLIVTLIATAIATLLGVLLSLGAAFGGRGIDLALGRLADIQLAIPTLLFAIVVLTFFGSGTIPLTIVLVVSGWVLTFRVVRSRTQQILALPYIEAARLFGARSRSIAALHVLPAVASLVIVLGALNFSTILILESSLGFLGLGVQPPEPDWGQMVAAGQAKLSSSWWLSIWPGAVLVLLLVGIQLSSDWISDRVGLDWSNR